MHLFFLHCTGLVRNDSILPLVYVPFMILCGRVSSKMVCSSVQEGSCWSHRGFFCTCGHCQLSVGMYYILLAGSYLSNWVGGCAYHFHMVVSEQSTANAG
jgi:hypothetical protein